MAWKGNKDPRTPCAECDGEGQVEVLVPTPYSGDEPKYVREMCEACSGEGVCACDHCGEEALKRHTAHLQGVTFNYCSVHCRFEDLGPEEKQ